MKTSNLFIRIEPQLKHDTEEILTNLGLSVSSAINLFFRQIVLTNGLPFDVKMPKKEPMKYELLTEEEMKETICGGIEEVEKGDGIPFEEVTAKIKKKYDL